MPIDGDFQIEVCDWANAADREGLREVREDVFVREQHVPREMEIDDDDPRSVHVLARTRTGAPIGSGRLTPDGRVGRVAVMRDWRGRGVGTMLLQTLLEQARARRLAAVFIHAQCEAVPFWLRHGFTSVGEEFEEAGIPHVAMQRALDNVPGPDRSDAPAPPEATALHATTREELIGITLKLLGGARHSMCVRVRELHPHLLNDTACLVELRRLAISGRGASIRILASDLTRALQEGTRLLELAQRLSSVIEMRRPVEPADLAYGSAFMCVDAGGYLFRPQESEMVTIGSTYAPGRHAELMRLFEEVWARSEPWPELRTLGI